MRLLFDFIYKHIATIFFVILEMVAVGLLYNRNEFSRTVIAHHALTVQSHLSSVGTTISDYFSLATTNRHLSDENARLNQELASYRALFDSLRCDSVVSTYPVAHYVYTPAKIIFLSDNGSLNYSIIDKGSADGITEDMGVVCDGSAYGVVGSVAPHYAVVLPLINTTVRVSAKIGNNEQLGMIVWDGGRRDRVVLEELPSHVHPHPGDSIFSSSFSSIFPENVLIGTVSRSKNKSVEGFSHINVNLAVDYACVRYVAIIRNKNKNEYNSLVQEMETQSANTDEQ